MFVAYEEGITTGGTRKRSSSYIWIVPFLGWTQKIINIAVTTTLLNCPSCSNISVWNEVNDNYFVGIDFYCWTTANKLYEKANYIRVSFNWLKFFFPLWKLKVIFESIERRSFRKHKGNPNKILNSSFGFKLTTATMVLSILCVWITASDFKVDSRFQQCN